MTPLTATHSDQLPHWYQILDACQLPQIFTTTSHNFCLTTENSTVFSPYICNRVVIFDSNLSFNFLFPSSKCDLYPPATLPLSCWRNFDPCLHQIKNWLLQQYSLRRIIRAQSTNLNSHVVRRLQNVNGYCEKPLIVRVMGFDIMKIFSSVILTVGVVRSEACCSVTTPSNDFTWHYHAILHHCHTIKP